MLSVSVFYNSTFAGIKAFFALFFFKGADSSAMQVVNLPGLIQTSFVNGGKKTTKLYSQYSMLVYQ